jgi:hypothetical protein
MRKCWVTEMLCLDSTIKISQGYSPMDAEQINSIGSHLVDLTTRTLDLRGYL